MPTHRLIKMLLPWIAGVVAALSAVSNGWADNPASSCASTATNDALDTCYTLTPPRVDDMAFTLNGTADEPEWADAIEKTIAGPGGLTGSVRFLRSADALYLAVTIADAGPAATDRISVYVDPVHSASMTLEGDEFSFSVSRDVGSPNPQKENLGSGNPAVVWPVNGAPGSVGSELGIVTSATEWTLEVKIVKADFGFDSGVPDLPAISGIAVRATSPATFQTGNWPDDGLSSGNPQTWANLKTRFPVEYMLVLDQSGSMLSADKWDNAVTAANYLANTMAIFNNPDYFPDELGLVTFAWECSGGDITEAVDVDDDGDGDELIVLPDFPLGDYVGDTGVVDPVSNNCTPIGSGVNTAFAEVGTSDTEPVQRVFLVLSDGLHNRPNSDLLLSELDYTPCGTASWAACADSVIQINTVAFGGPGQVDEMLLDNIATYYQGEFSGATYNITGDPSELKEVFINTLDELYQMNPVPLDAPADPFSDFTVDANNQRLVVIAAWDTPADAGNFALELDDGDGFEAEACHVQDHDAIVGFAVCAVEQPGAGTWRAEPGNPDLATADRVFALLDLKLRARFAVDQVVHGTGRDIVLTADLNEAGRPLTHDPSTHPVSVTVDIRKPVEGLGTLVSTTQPDVCEQRPPQLPPLPGQGQRFDAANDPVAATSAGAANPAGDPPAPLYSLAAGIFERCDKDGIGQQTEPGEALFDDGTHGDATAGDGIYTLRYNNTDFEGSYVFDFNASGTTRAGDPFARGKTIAAYVRVEVDPGSSESGFRDIQVNADQTLREYYVIPRDHFGGYLGPGRAPLVEFLVEGAQPVGGVRDYNNGIYSQKVRFDTGGDEPQVIPVVQGKPVVVAPDNDDADKCTLLLWALALLVLLVLVLLWLLWLCHKNKRPT